MPVDLIAYALVAAILFVMLFRALGTRHGSEPVVRNPFVEPSPGLAEKKPIQVESVEVVPNAADHVPSDVQQTLFQMAITDKSFDANQFVANAREAYRIVIEAYAADDRNTLRDLLAPSVLASFIAALNERAEAGDTLEVDIRAIKQAEILAADLNSQREARITIRFTAEQSRVTKDKNGQILSGNAEWPEIFIDEWTFARTLQTPDPRWLVIETRDGDPNDAAL